MHDFNLESQTYKLNDLRETLKEGIEMRQKEAASYDYLVNLVEKGENNEMLPQGFLDGIKSNREFMLKDIDHLTMRIEYLTEIIKQVEAGNQDVKDTVTLMFNGLGIYMSDKPQPEAEQ